MNQLPASLTYSVAEALELRTGSRTTIVSAEPISGGCINDAKVIRTDRGTLFFLKHNASAPHSFFDAEAEGLNALRSRDVMRVPEVIAHGHSWLLLEYVPAGPVAPSFWEELGSGMAALHTPTSRTPGYERDNFIGPLTQQNEPIADWGEFWVSRRVRPQLELAHRAGLLDEEDRVWKEVLDVISEALGGPLGDPGAGGPSLLHGDLWSGNVYPDTDGRPVLIDPAVYRGDPEVDLAMSELFGGFDLAFYRSYRSSRLVAPEYDRVRRRVYQLYPLLVHANLFGAGYAASARATAAALVSESGRS